MILIVALSASTALKAEAGGFIDTSKIYSELQSLGYIPEQIDIAIIKGNNNKLIEVEGRKTFSLGMEIPRSIRATATGLYHINKLVSSFAYIDAVLIDTAILSEDVHNKLHNVKDIEDRLKRTEIFKSYLDEAWKSISIARSFFDWELSSIILADEIKNIRRKFNHQK